MRIGYHSSQPRAGIIPLYMHTLRSDMLSKADFPKFFLAQPCFAKAWNFMQFTMSVEPGTFVCKRLDRISDRLRNSENLIYSEYSLCKTWNDFICRARLRVRRAFNYRIHHRQNILGWHIIHDCMNWSQHITAARR